MDYGVEWMLVHHGFVKGIRLSDVWDDGEVKLAGGGLWVGALDFVGFLFGANGGNDCVTTLKESIEDVGCNEAGATFVKRLVDALES